jgi:hypothetical protein
VSRQEDGGITIPPLYLAFGLFPVNIHRTRLSSVPPLMLVIGS